MTGRRCHLHLGPLWEGLSLALALLGAAHPHQRGLCDSAQLNKPQAVDTPRVLGWLSLLLKTQRRSWRFGGGDVLVSCLETWR